MRFSTKMAACLLCAAWAAPALALQGAATGRCEGGDHVVTVTGVHIAEIDGEVAGLVFVREAIGVCAPAATVPDEPLPFVPEDTGEQYPVYTATAVLPAPADGAVYRYTPWAVRPDGSLEAILAHCDADDRSYALVSCAEAPLARGTLTFGPGYPAVDEFMVVNCVGDCWTESIGAYLDAALVEQLSGLPALDLVMRTVDVYGTRTTCTMPGGDYHTVTRIALTEGQACGPVPAAAACWSSLKASYR